MPTRTLSNFRNVDSVFGLCWMKVRRILEIFRDLYSISLSLNARSTCHIIKKRKTKFKLIFIIFTDLLLLPSYLTESGINIQNREFDTEDLTNLHDPPRSLL